MDFVFVLAERVIFDFVRDSLNLLDFCLFLSVPSANFLKEMLPKYL